jgi:hypothetical protein
MSSDAIILALPEELMTSAQAAEMLKLSPRTLEQMRVDGSGPPYLKAGGGIPTPQAHLKSSTVIAFAPTPLTAVSVLPA